MTTSPDVDLDLAYEAEKNSALVSGVLHLFAAITVPVLLWDAAVVDRMNLRIFGAVEVLLGIIGLGGYLAARSNQRSWFRWLGLAEPFGTAVNFAALAWLGDDVATETPSKYLLMVTLVALTSIAGANSSMLERRRNSFLRTLVIVGVSHFIAYAVHGEIIFASFTVLWCLSIAFFTHVGYQALTELTELRRLSDETARHDDLTKLLNRSAFMRDLQQMSIAGEPTALVLLDLDGFKAINDGFGHAAGDAVLRTVADRLAETLPRDTKLCRLGGDEFAALVRLANVDLPLTINRLIQRVGEAIEVDGRDLYVAGSVGWTEVQPDGLARDLLAEADAAMYRSKNSSTATSTGFNPAMRNELDRSLELRQRFRSALKQGRIDFRAQPIVRASDRCPVAVELLARWPDDEIEIEPEEFNRLADETGLAVELDRLALAAAAELLRSWRTDPVLQDIVVKANISPLHLHNLVLARSIRELVPDADRRRLGLEFVEARLMDAGRRHHALLRELLEAGVTLSMDDFGTGYSSLAYLRSLPLSEIKLDRSFITGIDRDPVNQGLVRAIVDLATTLDLTTVAEGVENDREYRMVAELGCTSVQGYGIGHPLPLGEVGEILKAQRQAVSGAAPRRRA